MSVVLAPKRTSRCGTPASPRWWRTMFTALSLPVLSACSAIEVAYDQADVIAVHQLDQYFDLSESQADDAERRIKAFLIWHRREQLPDYAMFLTELRTRFERGFTAVDIEWLLDGLRARYRTLALRLSDDAADFLAGLEERQIAHLRASLDLKNRDLRQEWHLDEPPEDQTRQEIDRILRRVEDWTGALSEGQRRQVEAMLATLPLLGRYRYEERLRRQRQFLALVRDRADVSAFQSRFRGWLLAWDQGRARPYQRILDEYRAKSIAWVVRLDRLLTTRQRLQVGTRMADIINAITALTRAGSERRAGAIAGRVPPATRDTPPYRETNEPATPKPGMPSPGGRAPGNERARIVLRASCAMECGALAPERYDRGR